MFLGVGELTKLIEIELREIHISLGIPFQVVSGAWVYHSPSGYYAFPLWGAYAAVVYDVLKERFSGCAWDGKKDRWDRATFKLRLTQKETNYLLAKYVL